MVQVLTDNQFLNDDLNPRRGPSFIMSTLTHGGRIVPILTGHEQHHHELDSTPDPPRFLDSQPLQQSANPPLLDQRTHHDTMRHRKQVDHACLEMPCLKERGLFAVPTEGDGKIDLKKSVQ